MRGCAHNPTTVKSCQTQWFSYLHSDPWAKPLWIMALPCFRSPLGPCYGLAELPKKKRKGIAEWLADAVPRGGGV